MKRFHFRPTYSNVVATLALFFALAGGAWAATKLPKGSVGSPQLKNGAVTPAKLSDAAKKGVTGAKGDVGPQGALGPRGNEGPRGEGGSVGATGPQGVRGATGAIGATGSRGELGEVGLRGERGLTGATGQTGPEGHTGPEGKQGAEGKTGPTGPSDAYFDVSANEPVEIVNEPKSPLQIVSLPPGEYVLQAVLTVHGNGVIESALARCAFGGSGSGITLGSSDPFLADVTKDGYASLVGTTTAVVTEPSTAYVTCEASAVGTSFVIPAESGHLTVTKVGALHP